MADDEDQSSKTEEPTEKKLMKLREEGNVPKSKEVNNLFMLGAMTLAIVIVLPWQLVQLGDLYQASLTEMSKNLGDTPGAVGGVFQYSIEKAIIAILPMFGILMLFAWFGGFIQTGPLLSFKAAAPKLSRISLLQGLKRMFSMQSLAEFLKSILKLVILGAIMGVVMYVHRVEFVLLADVDVWLMIKFTYKIVLELLIASIAVMVVLAISDFLFQKYQFTQQNMMSRKDLKDETKDSEGDPHVKNRQRQIRMERARSRMMQSVPESDVVITNPTHYAVALRYRPNEGDNAPTVIAKGQDFMALRIRELASEHDVPLYEDPPLARQLYAEVEIEQEIPVELYEVTAKVISFVNELKAKVRRG